ncbi:MAG: hypothetical protein AAF757_20275 [Cyanobacteria bacterium P01_D01_bin.116]
MKSILMILIILSSIIEYAPQAIGQKKQPTATKQSFQSPKKTPPANQKNTFKTVYTPRKPPKTLSPVPGRREGMGGRSWTPTYPHPSISMKKSTNKPSKIKIWLC